MSKHIDKSATTDFRITTVISSAYTVSMEFF